MASLSEDECRGKVQNVVFSNSDMLLCCDKLMVFYFLGVLNGVMYRGCPNNQLYCRHFTPQSPGILYSKKGQMLT